MYTRSKERTERMINRYFKKWNRIIPSGSHPFNGIVKLNKDLSYIRSNFNFTFNKKYYVVNGFILDDKGFAYGVYSTVKDMLNEGMCPDFPAYPIESFKGLEDNLFEIIKEY